MISIPSVEYIPDCGLWPDLSYEIQAETLPNSLVIDQLVELDEVNAKVKVREKFDISIIGKDVSMTLIATDNEINLQASATIQL